MTNVDQPQARARRASTHFEVWCPQEDDVRYELGDFASAQAATEAAARHNDLFTPPHNASASLYVPPWDELQKQLTGDQLETLQKAALLVIGAREEAATLLTRAGAVDFSRDFFGSRCHECVCPQYQGRDETTCERDSCRHSAAQHAT
ncbi:hypothetical protein PV755_02185 [Streptomyces caniscabiei]|uniref:Uncharacterized protein n=1 Tax=Streptomyces caniscabiei TaxID=2746961 RepID=A0A927L5M8_9ACTN|nr:DUF6422 family protein [Streptomyces caniscabiei]MBD9726022.1 hypothetical protein [Streptomyces caniscabiei]MDX3507745.1 hypothetical protein [Streptomyces caniscabiei]MDX3717707.1 hypothetical protein [Streptomyces caniscabiei]WEO25450.1 hypothetical protein IHE65_20925 [Streptomyces caniscabiei]